MAAKKRKRAKKVVRPAKGKKALAKSRKTATKPARSSKAKKNIRSSVAKAPATRAVKSSRQTKGEGDYAASRRFLKDQSDFVEKNKAAIPAMGKEAEAALDGPQGESLRAAEATAAARSRDTF